MVLFETLDHLLQSLQHRDRTRISFDELKQSVAGLGSIRPMYNDALIVGAFAVLSATMAPAFFNGNWRDGVATLAVGGAAGAMAVACDYFPGSFLYMHELVSSFVSSLLTVLGALVCPGLCYWPIVLASTIWILPGFSMVLGTIEIGYKFFLPGLAMHLGGLFVAFIMATGFSLSIWTVRGCVSTDSFPMLAMQAAHAEVLPLWLKLVLCVLFSISCSMIYHSSKRQMIVPCISVLLCYGLCVVLESLPIEVCTVVVSFCVGIVIRVCAGVANQIPEASIYVAILPLVPGSRVVRSAFGLLVPMHGIDTSSTYFAPFASSVFVCVCAAFGQIAAKLAFDSLLSTPVSALGRRVLRQLPENPPVSKV